MQIKKNALGEKSIHEADMMRMRIILPEGFSLLKEKPCLLSWISTDPPKAVRESTKPGWLGVGSTTMGGFLLAWSELVQYFDTV